MRTTIWKNILPIFCAIGMLAAAHVSYALDAPHDVTKTITCDTCHIASASTPSYLLGPYTGDESYNNNLCMNCHNALNPQGMQSGYSNIFTHSSSQTGSVKYGTWMVECVTCHNPHNQKQASFYVADPQSSIVAGTQSGAGTGTTLTVNTVLSANTLTNYILIPNTVYPAYMYRITGNTTNVITVTAAGAGMPLALRGTGKSFAVKYGKMVKEKIAAPTVGIVPVKFYNNSGPRSFATSTDPANITSVCQVCHQNTTSFNVGGTLESGHPPNKAGTDCTSCHMHDKGFKADCAACHGSPPINAIHGDPNGLALGTVTTTPGKHEKHAMDFGIGCEACHTGYVMPEDPTPFIDLSFSVGKNQGNYTGQSGARYRGRNGTTVADPGDGTMTCSNIYCHSSAQSVTGGSPAIYQSVTWVQAGPLGCAACHVDMSVSVATSGSHSAHTQGTSNYDCSSCHAGYTKIAAAAATHANGVINVDAGLAYSGDGIPANSNFGSCSTASCHANVYGAGTVATPVWGTTNNGCSACHSIAIAASGPNTGSHALHGVTDCSQCHQGALNSTTTPTQNHIDTDIDVMNGYPANVTKHTAGSYTGTCSTASCHSNVYGSGSAVTPIWGSTGAGCSACHSIAIGSTGPDTGSHVKHGYTDCTLCHSAGTTATTKPTTSHTDGDIDVTNGYPATAKHAVGTYTGTCSTASCHSNVYGAGLVTTPVWSTASGCSACHSIAIGSTGPATGSHVKHGYTDCTLCHSAGTTETSKPSTSHADGDIDVTNGYPATAKHAAGTYTGTCSTASCHANPYGAGFVTTPTWSTAAVNCTACHSAYPIVAGSTGPATGSHVLHNETDCTKCHNAGTTSTTPPLTSHTDGDIDVTNGYPATAKHAAGSYTGACSTAMCHGSLSPVWGNNTATPTCEKCHGSATTVPFRDTAGNTLATDAQVGAHVTHLTGSNNYSAPIACTECHAVPALVGDAGHYDTVLPAENTWGTLATTGSITPSYAGGNCSLTYCHGNAMPKGSPGSTGKTPSWTDTAYLNGIPNLSGDCGKCHEAPPVGVSPHNAGMVLADCTACHTHFDATGALVSGQKGLHINGIVEATGGTCDGCHDYDTTNGGTDWGKSAKAVEGWGAHALHIQHLKTLSGTVLTAATDTFGGAAFNEVCGVCHTQTPGNHAMGGTPNTRTINFGDGKTINRFSSLTANITYNGVTGNSSSVNLKTCSNVNCHFQPAPVWQGF